MKQTGIQLDLALLEHMQIYQDIEENDKLVMNFYKQYPITKQNQQIRKTFLIKFIYQFQISPHRWFLLQMQLYEYFVNLDL